MSYDDEISMARNEERADEEEQEREPRSWRCGGCGEVFRYDQGGSHPVHDSRCDGSCTRGCPVECGPVTPHA